MNNKKKVIIAGSLAAFLAVGGTAAFFTSSDSIANIFNTGKGTDNPNDLNAGVDVEEDFKPLPKEESFDFTDELGDPLVTLPGGTNPNRPAGQFDDDEGDNDTTENGGGYGELEEAYKDGVDAVLPGEVFTKKMNIGSNVDYAQYLRAKIVITVDGKPLEEAFKDVDLDEDGEPIASAADLLVQLNHAELGANWNKATVNFPEGEGGPTDYYFYKKTLASGDVTPDLVQAVALAPTAGNWWKGKTINVELHAEGIQATTDAWASWMELVDPDIPVPAPVPAP